MIGLVDTRQGLWRKLEESTRISTRKGGDRFPAESRGDNRLQYAGVTNQFFGSMKAAPAQLRLSSLLPKLTSAGDASVKGLSGRRHDVTFRFNLAERPVSSV